MKRERASLMASLAASRGGGAGALESSGPKEGGASTSPSASSLLSGAELQAADAARLRAEVAAKRSALDAARDEAGRLELRLQKLRLDVAEASAGLREVAVANANTAATTSASSPASSSSASSSSTPLQLRLALSPAAARVLELEAKLRACEATLNGDSARQRLYELLEERTR